MSNGDIGSVEMSLGSGKLTGGNYVGDPMPLYTPQPYYSNYYGWYPVIDKSDRLRFALELIEDAASLAEAKKIAAKALAK